MKTTGATATALVVLFSVVCIVAAGSRAPLSARTRAALTSGINPAPILQVDPNTKPAEITPVLKKVVETTDLMQGRTSETMLPSRTTSMSRASAVKMADFYLRDGKLIFGRLVTEDKNKITIEQLDGSTIVVATYSKRDIDPRTFQTKNTSTSRYYEGVAEYFAGRVWDFADDPDDFIQAIRCYEKAKLLATGTSEMNTERIREIDGKIAELKADRERWTIQIESRAKLMELEFQAQYQQRFKELEGKIDASTKKIDDSIKKLNEILAEIQVSQQDMEQNIPLLEQDLRRRLDILGEVVDNNRRMLDPYNMRTRRRSYYGPGY